MDKTIDDPFIAQLDRAIARCDRGEGLPRVIDWTPEVAAPELDDVLPPGAPLPRGVTRHVNGNIYAYCYVRVSGLRKSHKVVFGQLSPTFDNAARAGRMAEAARACRDAGGDIEAVKAAVRNIE